MRLKLLFTFLLLILLQAISFGQTTQTFNYTGATQNFTVPAGVTTLTVECWGGGGAGGGTNGTNSENRTGGGGGGGGYTKNTAVSVTPGQIVAITVGAGGTGVTSNDSSLGLGNGNPGTASTFLTVTAAGGNGGREGNSGDDTGNGGNGGVGGSYTGGTGQSGNGGNGGGGGGSAGTASNGSNGTLAGVAAVTGGGKGAPGRSAGSGDGTSATELGGGGGGARMNSNNNNYKGGDGFSGKVVVSWACPTYSLSSTAVTTPICTGSTASVTLTNTTVANLPVGTYTVTYNLSAPNAVTGNTATMTVTTAGTGTFTTTALANSGSTTITITQLQSSGCTSAISTNRTATIVTNSTIIPTTQAGGTQTFCIDNGVTYTTPNANAGQYALINVIKGFKYTFSVNNAFAGFNENLTILDASNDASVTPATSATGASGTTITDWPCTLSGQIKVVLSAVGCANNGAVGSSGITVTQTAIGNTEDNQTTAGTNTWRGHIYNWTGTAPPGGASPSSPSATNPFSSSQYAGYYDVGTETINEGFGGDTACFKVFSDGTQRANIYTQQYAVRYRMNTTKNGCYLVNITGDDGVRLYLNGSLILDKWVEQSSTTYNNVLVNLDGNDDFVFDYYENGGQNVVALTIVPFDLSTNIITPSTSAVCSGTAVTLNGSSYLVNGAANPSLTFQWESSPTSTGPWTNTGVTTEDYSVSPTITTYYRRIVKGTTANNSGCSVTSDPVVINVNTPAVTNMTVASCSGSAFTVLPVNGTNGAVPSGTTYTWSAPSVTGITGTASGTNQANISGTLTNTTNAPINIVYTVTPTAAACTGTAFTVTVTVNPLPNNITNGFSATTICAGGSPELTFDADNSTFSGTYNIVYQNDDTLIQYPMTISSSSPQTFPAGGSPTANTSYKLISITNATCTRTASFMDPSADLYVRPTATATITGTTTVCAGASSPIIVFTNPQTVTIKVAYTINSGSDQTIVIPPKSGTVNGTNSVTVSTATGGSFVYSLKSVVYNDTPDCPNTAITGTATVTVNALPSITAQPSDSNVCEADNASFAVAASGAGLTYQWQLSTNGGGIFNNLSNSGVYSNVTAATMNITTAAITMNNYQYRCVVSGTCTPSVTSNSVTLHVNSDSGGISLNGGTPTSTNGTVYYCPSNLASFSIAPVSGASGYTWVVPAGWKTENGIVITGPISTAVPELKVITGTNTESGDVFVTAGIFCPSHIWVALSNTAPPAISISKTDPTCATPTGTVKAVPPSPVIGTLLYSLIKTSVSPEVTVAKNATGEFTGLAAGDYVVTYQINSGCYSDRSNSVAIVPQATNIWNGTSWSAGTPALNDFVIFDADYNEPLSVNSCSCTINSGADVIIPSGKVLTVVNDLKVDGTLTFKNGGSLIQKNENPNPNTLSIIYERTATGIKDFDYVYWSSPVAGQTLGDLSPLSDKYWSWLDDYWTPGSKTETMIEGKGYIARVPRYVTSQTVKFIGTPTNGDVTIAVQGNNKSNLIGNPYPSAIDAEQFMIDNQSVIPAGGMLAFWTHTTKRTLNGSGTQYEYESDDYAFFNITGGTATYTESISAGPGSAPDGTIAAGQSFMVGSETAVKNVFKFTNSMRLEEDNKNSHFFKQANAKKANKIEKNRIWLNLSNAGGAFKQLLVGYVTGATNGADKLFDGTSRNSNAYVDFYSVMDSEKYTIQGRSLPFNEEDEVPLGYKSTIEGTFQIGIDRTDGFMAKQAVYLEDKTANVIHDLTKGSYSFVTAKGEFKDRFVLRYNSTKLGTGDFDPKGKGVVVSVKDSQIKINSFDKAVSSVKVYDLKGSLLYEKNKVNRNEFLIDHFASSSQFMIVMIQLEDGKWVSEEIIFHD
ncbi:beta strand repeat-containing protein [Flavobacterium aestuarii]|uniref:beta strand repeat-containing protein n=1 Tax=Flavobacterium aestuarii TaxID=3149227 RepID=UPI0032B4D770